MWIQIPRRCKLPHDARHFHMCTPLTQTPNSAVRRQPSPQLYLALSYLMFLPVLWQFVLNLLLPWTSKVAYLSRGSCGRAPDFLRDLNFCCAMPDDCLQKFVQFTVGLSTLGQPIPPVLAKFWRCCTIAAPPERPGYPPYNVNVLSEWFTAQCDREASGEIRRVRQTLLCLIKEGLTCAGVNGGGQRPLAITSSVSATQEAADATADRAGPDRTSRRRKNASESSGRTKGTDFSGSSSNVPRQNLAAFNRRA